MSLLYIVGFQTMVLIAVGLVAIYLIHNIK